MKQALLIFGLVLSVAVIGLGQTRTVVTNSTLEKFQQKRLAAERDYRENYARMGFPSPEELDRQRETDMAARIQLYERLRQARLEKEKLELESRSLDLDSAALANDEPSTADESVSGGYYGGYPGYYSGRRVRRDRGRFSRGFSNGGYRVTPVGVYPQPPAPRPQRMILRTGPRGGGAIIRTGRH